MALQPTVSLEVLNINNTRRLGADLLEIITRMKADLSGPYRTCKDSDKQAIIDTIGKHTKIKVQRVFIDPYPLANAAASVWRFEGHHGGDYRGPETQPVSLRGEKIDEAVMESVVDLDKGCVTGPITKLLTSELYLCEGLFSGPEQLTAEEITAFCLHEVGHMFNMFLTLGDYVWLNYYLTDGVEVLLGRKANKYRLTVLTPKALLEHVPDPKVRQAYERDPTEANTRQALLTAFRLRPRHWLSSKEFSGSLLREEQLADLYTSRQGFARALVTGMDKATRRGSESWKRGNAAFVFAETMKILNVMIGVALIPAYGLGIIWLCVAANSWNPDHTSSGYDNPTERLTKFRRDLIAQLKAYPNDATMRASISDDIKVIDLTLTQYNTHRTTFEVLSQLFSKEARRNYQLRNLEQTLESLLSNDLFLAAQRIDQIKPRA